MAIVQAIKEKFNDFEDEEILSDEHIAFVKERIREIEANNSKPYSWEEVKEQLKNRWDMQ